MSEETHVTAIAVEDGFNPEDVDYSRDPNSGAMPQPGGAHASHAPVIDDGDVSFDAGVADEDTDLDEDTDSDNDDDGDTAAFAADVPNPLVAAGDALNDAGDALVAAGENQDGSAVQE